MNSDTCNFLHVFLHYGSTVLYNKYVRSPTFSKEAQGHMATYRLAVLPGGAARSTDATHFLLEKVHHRHRQAHLVGFKMCHTACTYNITINHRRQILPTSSGHLPLWRNGMTKCWHTLTLSCICCMKVRSFIKARSFIMCTSKL
jgi:hypothetical protein